MDSNENSEDKTLDTSSKMEVSESSTQDSIEKEPDGISPEKEVEEKNHKSENDDNAKENTNSIEKEPVKIKILDVAKINNLPDDSVTTKEEKKDNDKLVKKSTSEKETESLKFDTPISTTPPTVKDPKEGRRKRKSINTPPASRDSPTVAEQQNGSSASKRKKLQQAEEEEEVTSAGSDRFCWRCHKESVEAQCSACPRSWHRRCMGGAPPLSCTNWLCAECTGILQAENVETRSQAMAQLTVDQLCMMLKHVIERMRDQHGSEPFLKAVDLNEVPNYLDYVVKPMDLSLLESNVRAKLYGSTDAFMADARWIQHNCIVFNTYTSKLTNTAKQMLKVARQEVSEIEACPDCFAHGRNLPRPLPSWFIEPCRRPHPIVWAKLKGFPFWPAKAMPRLNAQGLVDVRFFGEHDRAWVSPKDIYLYSQDPPMALPKKKKHEMEICVKEVEDHSKKLEQVFGEFRYAPSKVQYDPHDSNQIKLLLPNYDPITNKRIDTAKTEAKTPVNNKVVPPKVEKKTLNSKNVVASTNGVIESPLEKRKIVRKKISIDPPQPPVNKASPEVEAVAVVTKSKSKSKSPPTTPTVQQSVNNNTSSNELSKSKSSTPEITEIVELSNNSNPKKNVASVRRIVGGSIKKIKLIKDFDKEELKKTNAIAKSANGKVIPPLPALNSLQNHSENVRVITPGQKPKTVFVPGKLKTPTNAVAANSKISARPPQQENRVINKIVSKPVNRDAIKFPVLNKNDLPISNKPMTAIPVSAKKDQTKAMYLAMNSNTSESAKHFSEKDSRLNTAITVIKQEPRDDVQPKQLTITRKSPSKARKSFPNKPPNFPQVLAPTSALSKSASSSDAMVYIPAQSGESLRSASSRTASSSSKSYELPPPEAGPVTAQIHQNSKELANRVAQLIADTIKETAERESSAVGDNSVLNHHEATIHYLKLRMERMRWEHQQEISELKHNNDLVIREMKASMEVERYRALQDARREAEIDKMRCIEETKRKLWCVVCGREAMFYCCWNTAYCDYPCQQKHWSSHISTCARKRRTSRSRSSSSSSAKEDQPRVIVANASDAQPRRRQGTAAAGDAQACDK